MNAVHVRNQKHELTPPRNRDKPVTKKTLCRILKYLPRLSARAGPVVSLPRHPLCHPVRANHRSSALQSRRNCNRLPHYDAT
ncbi:hypothetical protein V6N12_057019 [Hibiscus sabdariffa]|uniref:Uncharacterized protein n=1 Tax=Hibiscus sabdariffa TaxID=183260 RepID=A0ABR2DCR1_9ROSI